MRACARCLLDCLPGSDAVARIGGDEFAALVEDLASPDNLVTVAAKLHHAFAPSPSHVSDAHCGASIGAVFVLPGSEPTPHVLLAVADAAMYRAKHRGGQRLRTVRARASWTDPAAGEGAPPCQRLRNHCQRP